MKRGVIMHHDDSGYQARLATVEVCEWTGDNIVEVLRQGPDLGNAGLPARTKAMRWAESIDEPWIED